MQPGDRKWCACFWVPTARCCCSRLYTCFHFQDAKSTSVTTWQPVSQHYNDLNHWHYPEALQPMHCAASTDMVDEQSNSPLRWDAVTLGETFCGSDECVSRIFVLLTRLMACVWVPPPLAQARQRKSPHTNHLAQRCFSQHALNYCRWYVKTTIKDI